MARRVGLLAVPVLRPEGGPVIYQPLLWTPRAKERARTVIRNGRHMTFTPKATRDAEAALGAQWAAQPVEGPIAVFLGLWDDHVDVSVDVCPEPVSPKLRRGDIDNYVKLIFDALNGVAWVDDRQIAALSVRKM